MEKTNKVRAVLFATLCRELLNKRDGDIGKVSLLVFKITEIIDLYIHWCSNRNAVRAHDELRMHRKGICNRLLVRAPDS